MAKLKETEQVESAEVTKTESLVKVKVLTNLKYDKEIKRIGEELEVRAEDVEEMVKRQLVEVIK